MDALPPRRDKGKGETEGAMEEEGVGGYGFGAFKAEALAETPPEELSGPPSRPPSETSARAAASAKSKLSLKTILEAKVQSLCLEVQFKLQRELCQLLCNELRDSMASRSVIKASTNLGATEDVQSHQHDCLAFGNVFSSKVSVFITQC